MCFQPAWTEIHIVRIHSLWFILAIKSDIFFQDYGVCNCTDFTNTITFYNTTDCKENNETVTYIITLHYVAYTGTVLSFKRESGKMRLYHELKSCSGFEIGVEYPVRLVTLHRNHPFSNWSCIPFEIFSPYVSLMMSETVVSMGVTYRKGYLAHKS